MITVLRLLSVRHLGVIKLGAVKICWVSPLMVFLLLTGCGVFELVNEEEVFSQQAVQSLNNVGAPTTSQGQTASPYQATPFTRMTPPEGLRRMQCRELVFATENAGNVQTAREAVELFYVLGLSTGYVIGYSGGTKFEDTGRSIQPTAQHTSEFAYLVGEVCRKNITMSVIQAVERAYRQLKAARPDSKKLNIFR